MRHAPSARGLAIIAVFLTSLTTCRPPSSSATSPTIEAPPAATPSASLQIQQGLQDLADRLVKRGAPGAILAAQIDGAQIVVAAGLAQTSPARFLKGTEPFRIGSLTKTYIAALLLLLQQDGLLSLDDSAEQWLPGVVPQGDGISIRMLMHQTSGLYDYADDRAVFEPYETDPGHHWQPLQLVDFATRHRERFAPGLRWGYSNTNYILLGLIAEAAGGRPLDLLLRDRLLEPLGLRRTFLATNAALPAEAVHGYLTSPTGELADASAIDPSEGWAAGGVVAPPEEVLVFLRQLLSGGILSQASLDAMKEINPAAGDSLVHAYGLGIYQYAAPCGLVWGHDGDIFGYQTVAFATQDGARVLVAMVNRPGDLWWLDSAAQLVLC